MQGKVCLITGANSGIGKATALGLARMGATVVMVCRDRTRGEEAQREIKTQSGNDAVDLLLADLSSQQSIYMPTTGGKIMSKFTDIELEYLKTQRLGRLATINKNGEPQIAPVTFLYNVELDTIDIGGLNNGESQKFRNVARNGLASFVVDDVLPPFQPRGIEIRGHAEALPDGGQRISPNFSPALIRLTPGRIISWNLTSGDPAQTHSARNV